MYFDTKYWCTGWIRRAGRVLLTPSTSSELEDLLIGGFQTSLRTGWVSDSEQATFLKTRAGDVFVELFYDLLFSWSVFLLYTDILRSTWFCRWPLVARTTRLELRQTSSKLQLTSGLNKSPEHTRLSPSSMRLSPSSMRHYRQCM